MMVDTAKYETRYYVHESDDDPFSYDYCETLEDATSEAEGRTEDYSKEYAVTEVLFKEIGTTKLIATFEMN